FLDLAEDPTFIELVFGALVRDEVNEVLWNDHRTIIVDDDDVAGKYRAAATTDRLLPADKRQTIDGCRSGDAGPPDWKRARQNTGTVTHDAVGDECRDIALFHARAQNVAKDAGAWHAHRVRDRDHAFRHVLNCGARRDRTGPALRRRQVLAH